MFLFKFIQPRGMKIWASPSNPSRHINDNLQKGTRVSLAHPSASTGNM